MPKQKTHKGAASRFQRTGSGKLLRMKGGSSHLRRKKASRSKGLYDEKVPVHSVDLPRLRRLMPYG